MEPVNRMVAWVSALGMLVGCGGTTDHNRNHGAGGSDNPAGGTTAQVSAGDGATVASGGQPAVMTVDTFDTAAALVGPGLWMGFPDDKLPIGTPPSPHDGSALHLVGTTSDDGLDVFFHTPLPIERMWSSVRFWTQSDEANAFLTVAVAGPEPSYFKDRARGVAWPQRRIALSNDWQEIVFHVDTKHVSPHAEMFGAFHFIIEPNTKYDLWIDDFAGQPPY